MQNKIKRSYVTTKPNLRYGISDTPPIPLMIILAIQHLFGMFGATVLVPILVNQQAAAEVLSISVALFTSGVGTLWYQKMTGWRSPVYLGSSFAFIAPIAATYTLYGTGAVMTGMLAVGLVYIIVAILIKKVGTAWINAILPPVVRGPMILIIGLGLSSSAVGQIGISPSSEYNVRGLVVACLTLVATIAFIVGFRKFLHGFLNIIPFLAAIAVGYVIACIAGMVDFSPVQKAAWFALPEFEFIGFHYKLDFRGLWTFLPLSLATMSEHIGDHKALSTVIGKDLLEDPGLDRTLLGDGGATAIAAALGGPANTTYGENTSIVGMTKVASVKVITLAAIFACLLSINGKLTAMISTIPNQVLGGVSVMLYGFIGLNGIKDLNENHVNFNYMRNVAVAAPMMVLGLGGAVLSIIHGGAVIFSLSGMSLAAVVGVVINLAVPDDPAEIAEIAAREDDEALLAAVKSSPRLLEEAKQIVETYAAEAVPEISE